MDLHDSKSWDTAFTYLEEAESLISRPKALEVLSEGQLANLHRVTGNAYYNIGGKLYNAERFAGSATFIKRATDQFEKALEKFDACRNGGDAGKEEDWISCRRRLPQVWEALGRCNYKIGHLKVFLHAYNIYRTDYGFRKLTNVIRLL